MALTHAVVTVGTQSVLVNRSETDGSPGQSLTIQNTSAVTVYLGAAGVTTSAYGHALAQDAVLSITLGPDESLYAVAGSETTITVLALGA